MKNCIGVILVVALLLLPGVARGAEDEQAAASQTSIMPALSPAVGHTVAFSSRECGPDSMTQSTTPDSCESGSVACVATVEEVQYTTENYYARCYNVAEDITVNCVDFGVESCTSYVSADYDVVVTIYRDTDGSCPPDLASMQALGSMIVTVPDGTALAILTADFSLAGGVPIEAPAKMVVEVYAPSRRPETDNPGTFWIGSNNDGEGDHSYLYSESCDIYDYETFSSIGYPDVHLVQTVWYYPGAEPPIGACCLPDGACTDGLTPGECDTDYDGEWQGTDTECATTECPQPPPGACCDPAGMCTEVSQFDCTDTWLGADTVCGDDCDGDGATDVCVIALELSEDCQPNDIPDECDIDAGTSADIDSNGTPDECECLPGSGDYNNDAVIDLADYETFHSCMTGPRVPYTGDCQALDMDGDCDVDLVDAGRFQASFGNVAPVVPTELAGNSLSEYPFFEYVKAFNKDATVEVAVDPTRFPPIIGRTCDIYVVEAKTAGQWVGDPSLVDVTAGGAQTETFGGTTVQANTFTVVGPYELDSDVYDEVTGDYTGLGAGYDMVLDCNQNGQLDGGDYIDGYRREAGLYIVHDTSAQGPLDVTELASYSVGAVFGIPSNMTYENTYYPSDIASMGELPLIVVSHGNGHNYTWYDHIGYHMASYGYIVMSHQNNTGPGIATCSLTTYGHTDAFLDQLDTIGGGAMEGHVDSHRITWIGHSRGAEGVAMAYHRVAHATGSCKYTPTHYASEDITLVSSMLPTDFYGAAYDPYLSGCTSDPRDVNYHLWTAAGDADVDGGPGSDVAQTFHLHDRAELFRQSTVVQGTGHGDFHASTGSVFTGPCHIEPKGKVHDIIQGYFLPLIKYYVEGNVPGSDFLWRQYERFHPIGVPEGEDPCIVVDNTFRNGANEGNFIIDDYQAQTSTGTSSSGGSVTYTVGNLYEGRLDDNNTTFTWTSTDPMNGFTYGATTVPDDTRGVVFDWNGSDAYYEWEIISGQQDFSDDLYLSFRAAQGTRHPYTITVLGDLTFTVTLRDGSATTSSINIGAYGGGIEEPYQRTGAGTGAGWAAEFEVIRIRLTDFLANGSGLDLTDIEAVRLNFGPSWGSNEGRIGVDEVMLTNDRPPYFIALTMSLTAPAPEFLPPSVPTVIEVEILEGDDTIMPDSALLHYRYDGGAWQTAPLVEVPPGSDLYEGTLPAPSCSDTPEFYFSVEGSVTGVVYDPPTGSSSPYIAFVGVYDAILVDDFETDQGWTVENDPSLTDGHWERAIPSTDGTYDEPLEDYDYDGLGYCYVTENVDYAEVDWGPTMLISPTFDLDGRTNPILRYARWWANDDQDGDPFDVEISNDDGGTWYPIETVTNIDPGWVVREVYITDYITPLTSQMKVRISAMDCCPNNSKDEGGIDAFELFEVLCSD